MPKPKQHKPSYFLDNLQGSQKNFSVVRDASIKSDSLFDSLLSTVYPEKRRQST